MGRMYRMKTGAQSVAAAQDLLEINVAQNKVIIVHEARITQKAAEVSEQLEFALYEVDTTTAGSGGSAVTPDKLDKGDANFAGTVERNNTTQAGNLVREFAGHGENVLSGFHYLPTPEKRPTMQGQGILVLALRDSPTNPLTIQGEVTVEELG